MKMKLPFQIDLSGKVAAVTGAGGVLMSEFARALAACGAKVALLDINADAVKKVAAEIGENALAVPCNCLDKASIEAAKGAIAEKWGAVNFLINGYTPKETDDNISVKTLEVIRKAADGEAYEAMNFVPLDTVTAENVDTFPYPEW